MSRVRRADLLAYAGGECFEKYGTFYRRTHPSDAIAETFTRSSTGYYINRDGALRIAEANALRTDWAGTGFATATTLLEGARTNAFTYSEELDNAAWTKTRASISANAIAAPDSTTTGDKLVEDGTASQTHFLTRALTITADEPLTVTFFAQLAERTELKAIIHDAALTNRIEYEFDLSAGTKTAPAESGSVSGGTSTMKGLGSGWYECTVTGVITGDTSVAFDIRLVNGTDTYSGDGSSGLYLWGLMAEEDALAGSSYIQSVASPVTRTAESCSLPFVVPPQEMTVYTKFVEGGPGVAGPVGGVFFIGGTGSGSDPRLMCNADTSGGYQLRHDDGTTNSATTVLAAHPAKGDTVELVAQLAADGGITLIQSINAAATTQATASGASLTAAWSAPTVYIGVLADSNGGIYGFQSIKIARGTKTMAEMREALG